VKKDLLEKKQQRGKKIVWKNGDPPLHVRGLRGQGGGGTLFGGDERCRGAREVAPETEGPPRVMFRKSVKAETTAQDPKKIKSGDC